jgi:tetratricopeptide (TPR) repeat protein
MSIIDSPFRSQEEMLKAMEVAGPMIDEAFARRKFTPVQKKALELMREGLSLADIFDLTPEQRNAIFVTGCKLLKVGDTKRARDILFTLLQLEPGDERVIYALGACFQAEGKLDAAARLYLFFLARDATNPEGYLRLGECLVAAKELENARQAFVAAAGEAERGNGSPRALAYARRMLGEVEAMLANNGSAPSAAFN